MQRSSPSFSSKPETLKKMIQSWQWWWLHLLTNMEFHKRKPRLVFSLLVGFFVISSFIYYHDSGHELVVLHPQCHCKRPFMNLDDDISNHNTTCSEVSSLKSNDTGKSWVLPRALEAKLMILMIQGIIKILASKNGNKPGLKNTQQNWNKILLRTQIHLFYCVFWGNISWHF